MSPLKALLNAVKLFSSLFLPLASSCAQYDIKYPPVPIWLTAPLSYWALHSHAETPETHLSFWSDGNTDANSIPNLQINTRCGRFERWSRFNLTGCAACVNDKSPLGVGVFFMCSEKLTSLVWICSTFCLCQQTASVKLVMWTSHWGETLLLLIYLGLNLNHLGTPLSIKFWD